MREGDIKMIDLTENSQDAEQPEETSDEVDTMVDPASDADNDQAIADLVGDNGQEVSESVESPAAGEKFCYLMITMK